jgi:hypothetical protein
MIYVLALSDWEDYQPIWFEHAAELTEEQFKKDISDSIDDVLPKILQYDGYIDGYRVLERIVKPMLRRGYHRMRPEHEIRFYGMCLYSDDGPNDKKPDIFSDAVWKAIIDHNEEIHREAYEDIPEESS